MSEKKISAFPDGNSYVTYNADVEKLIIGNSGGVAKVFDVSDPELEPESMDIIENLTCLAHYGEDILIASTSGTLEKANIFGKSTQAVVYRSELPIRDSVFINEGKRILCGGDDNKVIVIDTVTSATTTITTEDQVLNIAYNPTGELVSISLADRSVAIYSVVNESPSIVEVIKDVLPQKIHKSLDVVDFLGENEDELFATTTAWSADGQHLLVPTDTRSLKIFTREDFSLPITEIRPGADIVDYAVHGNFVATLHKNGTVKIIDFDSGDEIQLQNLKKLTSGHVPINIAWNKDTLYIGTTNGEVLVIGGLELPEVASKKSSGKLNSLFLDEAEESDGDDIDMSEHDRPPYSNGNGKHMLDDSIIDEDDDFDVLRDRGKRHKIGSVVVAEPQLEPYCPGSTPWTAQGSSKAKRRYICMNASGYVWAVKTDQTEQQSITVSFFDRSVNKDYHFIDYQDFDLCSMNNSGIVFGCSGYGKKTGSISFKQHESNQDAWERSIPLAKGEFITSLSLADSHDNNGIIVIGTNFGFVRFFNAHGLCINAIKAPPVVALISSSNSFLFMINQLGGKIFTYSIIDIHLDYKFVQQDVILPLERSLKAPLIKGLFFNEFNDPCMVAGNDDTLMILSSWRESRNARWIPILDCYLAVTDGGHELKKKWSCWPLGLYKDSLSCLILKGGSVYPGFPLALPIEIQIKLPVSAHKSSEEASEDDPEECFVRASTMGRIVSDTLGDEGFEENNEEIMERLQEYSMLFDKSLLKLFANACQEARLNKAFSIAKLIRTDKAMTAAARIAERLEFLNLATKIGKLREEMVED
ncbi:hypothetical protein QFC19_005315 [Naganishia cerealis]|uniref:Uncharacterized protein n=1 Tax=Naganishia cerealis TaxID=610337 RepID=A0ACC2VQH0_9TREE|nr:hypothetical protein QFC19_005315 [Naganishia cerealis]